MYSGENSVVCKSDTRSLGQTQPINSRAPELGIQLPALSKAPLVLHHGCELSVEVSLLLGREVKLEADRDNAFATASVPLANRLIHARQKLDWRSERALFVIDGAGVVRWSYVSASGVNPGADGILRALEALAVQGVTA